MQAINNKKMGMKSVTENNITMNEGENKSFIGSIVNKVKSYLTRKTEIEEVKMERKEIKNFNRKVIARREELNTSTRMFMFSR